VSPVSGRFRTRLVAIHVGLHLTLVQEQSDQQKWYGRPALSHMSSPPWALKGSRIGRPLVFYSPDALTCIEVCSHVETW
jgi:hypothetical protein